jgi:hypothetical protein
VKAVEPKRLVNISSTATHVIAPAGTVGPGEERNIREEAGRGPGDVAVDILAPHLPRTQDWAATTASRIATLRTVLDRAGSPVPIYLSEEIEPSPAGRSRRTCLRAAAGARRAQPAGCFTPTPVRARARSFLTALAPTTRALEQLSDKIRGIHPQ